MKFLGLIAASCCFVAAAPPFRQQLSALSRRAHTVSPYIAELKRQKYNSSHSRIASRFVAQNIIDDEQIRYLVPVTIGSQTLDVEFDTGSRDLWVVPTVFQCYTAVVNAVFTGPVDESVCNFKIRYIKDSSFTPYEGKIFRDCYGGTVRCVDGPYGQAAVTIAGLQITNQSLGLAGGSSYHADGNGAQAGIMGASLATTGNSNGYPSLFENLFTLFPDLSYHYSLALSRDEAHTDVGGSLVIGGIPEPTDPRINASTNFISTPFDLAKPGGGTYVYYGISLSQQSFYSQGIYYDSDTQVLIDSGNSGLDLPTDIASAWNAAFKRCDSPPDLWISVSDSWLRINPIDLLRTNADGTCSSLVRDGGSGPYWLGDPFLKNVIATFDWANQEMRFYPRPYYVS